MSVELPDPKDWGLSAYASAYGEACWNAALAASPPQEAQPVPAEDAVHGRHAHWLRGFVFKHKRDPYPQETWDAAIAQQAQPVPEPLSDDEMHRAMLGELDALLDHVYEYGTAAEGVKHRALQMGRAIERIVVARMGERK